MKWCVFWGAQAPCRWLARALCLLAMGCATEPVADLAARGVSASSGFKTDDPAYLKPLVAGVTATPILTVGEDVPQTSRPDRRYRMVGIPDGLGADTLADGTIRLLVNHELSHSTTSQPIVGGATQFGAFVSEYRLRQSDLGVLSGDLAFLSVYPGVVSTPVRGAFANFCASNLAGREVGFDRPIYLTGEESSGSATFDERGGLAVAIVDRAAYLLPMLGHFRKENVVVVPGTGKKTVIIGLEDHPSGYDSRLYLCVGLKDPSASHPLARNGLVGGRCYVFASRIDGKHDEASFSKRDGILDGAWVEIPSFPQLNDAELIQASRRAGAFEFARIEDGAPDRQHPGVFYFVTTGEAPKNRRGRVYQLTFDPTDPTGSPASIQALLEGDAGDPVLNPDNVATSAEGWLLIQEDPIGENRGAYMGGRDASIWLYDPADGRLMRIAEIDQTAVPKAMRGIEGYWETSGATDVSSIFGPGTWLIDVQAHSIDSIEASRLQHLKHDGHVVEGGQILLLKTDYSALPKEQSLP